MIDTVVLFVQRKKMQEGGEGILRFCNAMRSDRVVGIRGKERKEKENLNFTCSHFFFFFNSSPLICLLLRILTSDDNVIYFF